MEKIQFDNPKWGRILSSPKHERIVDANADQLAEEINPNYLTFWRRHLSDRGAIFFISSFILLFLSIAMLPEFLNPTPHYKDGQLVVHSELDKIAFSVFFTTLYSIPLISTLLCLFLPRHPPTFFDRKNRKVYGWSGVFFGRWTVLDFDAVTAVSQVASHYHTAGRTTLYSLWLCEVEPKTNRILKRISVIYSSRLAEVPSQIWEFSRAYMNLPIEKVPPVELHLKPQTLYERFWLTNRSLFGFLMHEESGKLVFDGPVSRFFAPFFGMCMYPMELCGYVLDRVVPHRKLPPELRQLVPWQGDNSYRLKRATPEERADINAEGKSDRMIHIVSIALAIAFWGLLLWLMTRPR